ncbi:gamma-glutamyl phosphate reductase [Alteromonas sp. KUL49]|nr:gamma-glutamyl phosphate reductase [Alteromonas sp. KUL49]
MKVFKNKVLRAMATKIRENASSIIKVNADDVMQAKADALSSAMIDRLTLTPQRIEDMAAGIETIAHLDDPVGRSRFVETRPNGIEVSKMRVPLGVVCMIYEARPNVTADAGALCFKSGNAVILRGGKEALKTSCAIAELLKAVLLEYSLPPQLITVVPVPDRELMRELMEQEDYIDVIIPRGGEGLIRYVTENSKVPVIQHYKGVCHLYIDSEANLQTAIELLVNGKTQRTGVCNALEGLIVHKDVMKDFLPMVRGALEPRQVKINACKRAAPFFPDSIVLEEDDFGQEYLDLEIAIRVVDDFDHALSHIDRFGSNHTEVICTTNQERAELFQRAVDASVVMANTSSRFSDGSELGLGAEIGIATTKLHAYGPMGIESLTTEKFIVTGNGQVRA